MSHHGSMLALFLAVLTLAGCSNCGTSCGLERHEVDYLSEDVVDLMAIAFQAAENAYLGDPVLDEDLVEQAGPGNDHTAIYDLPWAARRGLGPGFGRVALRIEEDGRPVEEPLAFSLATTGALEVVVDYDLTYLGDTGARDTDVELHVTVVATRDRARDPFLVDYVVDGSCFLGDTYCRLETWFRSYGRPRDGFVPEHSDGVGSIDDLDVYDVLDLNIDFREDWFRAQGRVGWRAYFEETFRYAEVW